MNPKEVQKLRDAALLEVKLAKRELSTIDDDVLAKDEKAVENVSAKIAAYLQKATTTVEPSNNPIAMQEVENATQMLLQSFLKRLSVILTEEKQAIEFGGLTPAEKNQKRSELGVIFAKHLVALKLLIRSIDRSLIGELDFSIESKINELMPDEFEIKIKDFKAAVTATEARIITAADPWDTIAADWAALLEEYRQNVVEFLRIQSANSTDRFRQLNQAEAVIIKAKSIDELLFDENPEHIAFQTALAALKAKIPAGYPFDGAVDLESEFDNFTKAKTDFELKKFTDNLASRRDLVVQGQTKLEADVEISEWKRKVETTYPELKVLADLTAAHTAAVTFINPVKEYADYQEKIAAATKLIARISDPDKKHFLEDKYVGPTVAVLNKLEGTAGPKLIAEQERVRTKENIFRFLRDIRVPANVVERKLNEPIRDYLERLHPYFIARVAALLWNKRYDNADSGERTHDYKNSPLLGPAEEVGINSKVLSYDQTDSQNVKTLESLFDMFRDFFDDPADHKEAAAFADRMKSMFAEMSVFHNRSVVRRHNDGKEGPAPAFEGIKKIFDAQGSYAPDIERLFNRTEMTDQEKRFSKATEFCMAVWSFENLKMGERLQLWPRVSAQVRQFFKQDTDPSGNPIIMFKYDGQVPAANGSADKQVELIEKMIAQAKAYLDPSLPNDVREKLAAMAYHIGESYRIGFGMEAFMDVKYFSKKSKLTGKPAVSVGAKMGEPKAASVGLYAESTNTNESRQDFNLAFEEYMVHGYLPLCRAIQYTHNIRDGAGRPMDIAGLGDMRATLAEILAVENGVEAIDWSSRSSNPDKTIMDQAVEAQSMWKSSALERSGGGDGSLFWKADSIPLGVTQSLNNDHEKLNLQMEFSTGDKLTTLSAKAKTFFAEAFGGPGPEFLEKYGFSSVNENITTSEKQRLATLIKHFRDYWLGGIMGDAKRYPLDILRSTKYLFQRNDRPENGYFVSGQMRKIYDFGAGASALPTVDEQKKRIKDFSNQLAGYMWFDVTLRATIYQYAPNTRYRREAAAYLQEESRSHIYHSLNDTTWRQYDVTNMVGLPAVNLAQVAWLINTAINIRDLLPEEKLNFFESGYRIDEHTSEDEVVAQQHKIPFTRNAVLRMAQKYNLAQGYQYRMQRDPDGKNFYQLQKTNEHEITMQDLMNRLLMMRWLFSKDLSVKK